MDLVEGGAYLPQLAGGTGSARVSAVGHSLDGDLQVALGEGERIAQVVEAAGSVEEVVLGGAQVASGVGYRGRHQVIEAVLEVVGERRVVEVGDFA